MTDRELLEFAAKAIDCSIVQDDGESSVWIVPIKKDAGYGFWWSPLTDDGDALRLAVKCSLLVHVVAYIPKENAWGHVSCAWHGHRLRFEPERFTDDPYSATRRAIVRAAAEIGKAMP